MRVSPKPQTTAKKKGLRVTLPNGTVEVLAMSRHRYFVYCTEKLFAVVHAISADQAIMSACRKTSRGYEPAACRAKVIRLRLRKVVPPLQKGGMNKSAGGTEWGTVPAERPTDEQYHDQL